MKTIAIFIPSLHSGGAEKQASILAALLAKTHIIHLITLKSSDDDPDNLERIKSPNIDRHFLSGNLLRQISQLKKIFQENHIDILFNYLTRPNILGSYAGYKVGVKRIYNGIRNSRLPVLKYWFEKFAHNHLATSTIFNCYSGAEYFIHRGFQVNKCLVIPNCFPNINTQVYNRHNSIKTIITVGRFVKQKDYLTAIKAINLLKREDYVFHIIGYGPLEKSIRKWISKYNLDDKVKIFINPSNIHNLLQDADIYLSTSLFEGTSNSIMEALNYCLPVVCTDVGDNSHLVQNNINGFLHKVKDCQNISKSLNLLLENPELRNKLGHNSNILLKNNFSTEVFLKKYLDLL